MSTNKRREMVMREITSLEGYRVTNHAIEWDSAKCLTNSYSITFVIVISYESHFLLD